MSVHIGQSSRHPFTILVSDDDPGVRRSTQLMLRAQGFDVLQITTPGRLDAELVKKAAEGGKFKLPAGFLQEVLANQWEKLGTSFQDFLSTSHCSLI